MDENNKPELQIPNNLKFTSKSSLIDTTSEKSYEYKAYDSTGKTVTLTGNTKKENEDLMRVLHANGIYRRSDFDDYNTFYRFPRMNPYTTLTTTREYIFFTKPDLFIFDNSGNGVQDGYQLSSCVRNVPLFLWMKAHNYIDTLKQLQFSADKSRPFMNLLSNRKTSNIDLTPIHADSFETSQNYYGTKLNYRKGSETSDENVEFSVEFEDTRYLDVYLLFRAYDEYEKLKWLGKVVPPKQSYIWNKVLHDQFGAFKITVGEDGKQILHWAQFWGVYPTNVPRDAFSDIPQDGHLKFTITFKAAFVEDMDIASLEDFEKICRLITPRSDISPIYDSTISAVNGENMLRPLIRRKEPDKEKNPHGRMELLWVPVKEASNTNGQPSTNA